MKYLSHGQRKDWAKMRTCDLQVSVTGIGSIKRERGRERERERERERLTSFCNELHFSFSLNEPLSSLIRPENPTPHSLSVLSLPISEGVLRNKSQNLECYIIRINKTQTP
jgi:hypothetical protein